MKPANADRRVWLLAPRRTAAHARTLALVISLAISVVLALGGVAYAGTAHDDDGLTDVVHAAHAAEQPAARSAPATIQLRVGALIGQASPRAASRSSTPSPSRFLAAKGESRVFANLAPEDAVRPRGFQSINPISLGSASGRYNYVVDSDGRLVLGNRRYGHIDLANGADVRAAGEVRVNGEVVSINNASGHYQPSGSSAQAAAEKAFGSSGLRVRSGAYSEINP